MVELVLIVCLLGAPDNCREERPAGSGLSPMACMTQGQIHAARWMSAHPHYQLRRWHCQDPGRRQQAT